MKKGKRGVLVGFYCFLLLSCCVLLSSCGTSLWTKTANINILESIDSGQKVVVLKYALVGAPFLLEEIDKVEDLNPIEIGLILQGYRPVKVPTFTKLKFKVVDDDSLLGSYPYKLSVKKEFVTGAALTGVVSLFSEYTKQLVKEGYDADQFIFVGQSFGGKGYDKIGEEERMLPGGTRFKITTYEHIAISQNFFVHQFSKNGDLIGIKNFGPEGNFPETESLGKNIFLESRNRLEHFFEENLISSKKGGVSVGNAAKSNPGTLSKSTSNPLSGGIWVEPITGMEFIRVDGGCFMMGCGGWTSWCFDDEKPSHQVCVDGFYVGKYEVTQNAWTKVMDSNPSYFKNGVNPVDSVSWNDAQEFIEILNARTKKNFRLPTEAEWEYAARSMGKPEVFAGGGEKLGVYYLTQNDANTFAWIGQNSLGTVHPVGKKEANGIGAYDMSGNAWEWCQDRYDGDYYTTSPKDNPPGSSGGVARVLRGGGWDSFIVHARNSFRYSLDEGDSGDNIGIRLVLPNPEEPGSRAVGE